MIVVFPGDAVTLPMPGDIMGAGWDPSTFGRGTTTEFHREGPVQFNRRFSSHPLVLNPAGTKPAHVLQ